MQAENSQLPSKRKYPSVVCMSTMHPHPLLDAIEAHRAKTGITETAFGLAAVGDPKFVFDLKQGREPRRKTVARVTEFIAGHTPVTRQGGAA